MRLSAMIHMTEYFLLKVNIHGLSLGEGHVRNAVDMTQHLPVLVDGVQGAFHQLTSF